MAEQQPIKCPHCDNINMSQQIYCGYCSKKLHPKSIKVESPQVASEPMQIIPERKPKTIKQTTKQIIEQQQRDIEQLQVNLAELQGRYIDLENAYLAEHQGFKPRANKILTLVAVLCALALIVVLFFFFKTQGGLPPEILKLLP